MTSYLWFCLIETGSAVVQATVQDLKDSGFDCWETSIGGPGVQQHAPVSVKEEILEVLNRYWTLRLFELKAEARPWGQAVGMLWFESVEWSQDG